MADFFVKYPVNVLKAKMSFGFTDAQNRVIDAYIWATVGWNKRYAWMSEQSLSKATGLSESSCRKARAFLLKKNVLIRKSGSKVHLRVNQATGRWGCPSSRYDHEKMSEMWSQRFPDISFDDMQTTFDSLIGVIYSEARAYEFWSDFFDMCKGLELDKKNELFSPTWIDEGSVQSVISGKYDG